MALEACGGPWAVPKSANFDGGNTAPYLLRWFSTRGERGPWSETAHYMLMWRSGRESVVC